MEFWFPWSGPIQIWSSPIQRESPPPFFVFLSPFSEHPFVRELGRIAFCFPTNPDGLVWLYQNWKLEIVPKSRLTEKKFFPGWPRGSAGQKFSGSVWRNLWSGHPLLPICGIFRFGMVSSSVRVSVCICARVRFPAHANRRLRTRRPARPRRPGRKTTFPRQVVWVFTGGWHLPKIKINHCQKKKKKTKTKLNFEDSFIWRLVWKW